MTDQNCRKTAPRHDRNSQMTIADAIDLFQEYGDEFRPDAESLVRVLRRANVSQPLENSNYLHALELTDLMMRNSHRSFDMVTGSAVDQFL